MRVLAITGSPGTGKHTVAAAVSERTKLRQVDLGKAAASLGLCEYDAAADTSDVDTARLARGMREGGMLGGRCLVVGHLAPYVLDADQVGAMVVLRRSPYELERIYSERGYGCDKAAENIGAEILGVVAHDAMRTAGAPRTVQIDTTGRPAAESAARAESALLSSAAGRGPSAHGDAVDWLALVAGRGDLGRFFPHGPPRPVPFR